MKKKNRKQNGRTIGKKTICLTMSTVMVLALAGCGQEEAEQAAAETAEVQEQVLNGVLNAQVKASHSSEAGKEETVYVLADANGGVNQVIVSNWLKNADGGQSITDCSELTDIQNVKGYETFEKDADGNITWQAEGSDIYYQGTTDKEIPVEVKISYQLDGKNISADDLAGKSGRVTIRMDYENKETRKVRIGGKEQEIAVPFAMISGMILPQDTFSNIEVTNARLLSEGNNSVVVGLAFPGLKESIDVEELKDKLEDTEENKKLKELEIPDYIEVSADTESFELGMTMTVAMSDVLSDIELTDSLDLSELNDSMDELRDAADQLKDGTAELKDGSSQLKDGTGELAEGTGKLWDGTVELQDGAAQLKDGTQELHDKSGLLNEGALALYDGTTALQDGAGKLTAGASALQDGGQKLAAGTGSLVEGAQKLNDGAHRVKDGVNQMAGQVTGQMNQLKAAVGTPVNSTEVNLTPGNLLEISHNVNLLLKKMSEADGVDNDTYNLILANLQQKKVQVQENLNNSTVKLSETQAQAAAAQAEMAAVCQGNTQEFEAVVQTRVEEKYVDVMFEASVPVTTRTVSERTVSAPAENTGEIPAESGGEPAGGFEEIPGMESIEGAGEVPGMESVEGAGDISGTEFVENSGEVFGTETTVVENTTMQNQLVTGTGIVTQEVKDTEMVQVQTVDPDALQQKVEAYQNAMEEVTACQAEVNAYSMQLTAIDEEIALMDNAAAQIQADQKASIEKWGPVIGNAAMLEESLVKLSSQLNSGSTAEIAVLLQGVEDLADGTQSAFMGATELNSGANELNNGIVSLNNGANELAGGVGELKVGVGQLKDGTEQLVEGTGTLNDGAGTLNDGIGTLKDGVGTLRDGVLTLDDGMSSLDEGALELMNGMFEFDEEGISKLTELFGDDVQDVVDRLKAVADAGKEYDTFTGLPGNMDGSVKFIIKTEAVEHK